MNNIKIRIEMAKKGLRQWQVASLLGISESVFSRRLRNEISEEEQERIIKLIQEFDKQ